DWAPKVCASFTLGACMSRSKTTSIELTVPLVAWLISVLLLGSDVAAVNDHLTSVPVLLPLVLTICRVHVPCRKAPCTSVPSRSLPLSTLKGDSGRNRPFKGATPALIAVAAPSLKVVLV